MATLDGRTRHSHRQLDGEKVKVGEKFSNGCRYPGDPEAPYAETMNCRCTLVGAVDGFDTDDARRWSRLPEGMTYEQWKGEGARLKPQGNYPVPTAARSVGADIIDLDKAFPEVRLPKKEYAKVLSAINANYHANHAGETFGSEIVDQDDGAYVYTFLVGDFNEYRIIGRERVG